METTKLKLKICNQYDMAIDRSIAGLKTNQYDSFFDLGPKRLRILSNGAYCYDHILRGSEIPTGGHILELFGGIGRSGIIIQNALSPEYHEIREYSQEYVDHMRTVLTGPKIDVRQGDAYTYEFRQNFDLVCLDWSSCTFMKLETEAKKRSLILDAAAHSSRILATFTSLSMVPLLRNVYTKKYGIEIESVQDYLREGSKHCIPGFQARSIWHTNLVYYVLFEKDWNSDPEIHTVHAENARGWFRIVE